MSNISYSTNDDTVKYVHPFKYESVGMKLYLDAILPIKKDNDGSYTITFMLPDCFYFPDKPNVSLIVYGYTGQLLFSNTYYGVEKGSQLTIQPGNYLLIFYVEEDTYIIELR